VEYSATEMMTIAAARALGNDDVCFVGIGAPSVACNLARLAHAPDITLIYESGTLGTRPDVLPLSIGDPELCHTALTTVSVPEMFAYWLQGGRISVGFLGGAQIDRFGNINSTHIVPRPFLVGSGGGNDVASTAAENVIVATLTPQRTVPQCSYITSPGVHVRALVTDKGVFEKDDGELALTALAPGVSADDVRGLCGWELRVVGTQALDDVTADEVAALRQWDPKGWFLRP
jgi:glutaconate CoA-transferase, subunit B